VNQGMCCAGLVVLRLSTRARSVVEQWYVIIIGAWYGISSGSHLLHAPWPGSLISSTHQVRLLLGGPIHWEGPLNGDPPLLGPLSHQGLWCE
jgi:hypothetical protein